MSSRLTARVILAAAAALVCAGGFPATGLGADRIYWANLGSGAISFVALDASLGGDLNTAGTIPDVPVGLAVDSSAGRIYWPNFDNRISFANLDGSGGGELAVTGATLSRPRGVAVDPTAGRIYWSNIDNRISLANLDGSGGGDINTAGATVSRPTGVAVDPAAGRIYWANDANPPLNKISFANLDGSGGGDINTAGATVDNASGVAVDPVAGRIYWANGARTPANKISFANLNGTGGADINTTGATVNGPYGLAIDPAAGRIYWGNDLGNKISFANLNGTGGGDLPTLGATVSGPNSPVLLLSPRPAGSPAITGGPHTGATLSCSQGTWAADLLASFLYRAPRSFAYQWSVGGVDIPGADRSSLSASAAGEYRCRVTAQNHAGAATQTSEPHAVAAPAAAPETAAAAFGLDTKVTLLLAVSRISARGPVSVRVANANDFAISGRLSGRTIRKVTGARKRRVTLKAKPFDLAAGSRRVVRLKLPKPLRRVLKRKRKLALRLTASVTDPAGTTRTVSKKVKPKLKPKRGKRRAA